MKHEGLYLTLCAMFTPLSLKLMFLLFDRPHTRSELYEQCSNWNNTVVKQALNVWKQNGVISGGETRGDAYRLTVKGVGLAEWLLEGGMVI